MAAATEYHRRVYAYSNVQEPEAAQIERLVREIISLRSAIPAVVHQWIRRPETE